MTHSAPNEPWPAADSIRSSLEELTAALISLDPEAVEACCSRLEELGPQLVRAPAALRASGKADLAELVGLRSSARLAQTLSLHAVRFYHGWTRVAALEGAAYTPNGQEPDSNAAGSVKLQA
jgi:hypothetical protein